MDFTQTTGGLLVPEGSQEAAIAAALRNIDDTLRLVPQDSDAYGRRIYKVYRFVGPARPAEFLCVWTDKNGEPLPLSSALVDFVQSLDRNTRGHGPTLDELEKKHRDEQRKDYLRDAEAIVKEFGPKLDGKKQTLLPRSRSLYMARNKERAKQKHPEFRP